MQISANVQTQKGQVMRKKIECLQSSSGKNPNSLREWIKVMPPWCSKKVGLLEVFDHNEAVNMGLQTPYTSNLGLPDDTGQQLNRLDL